MKLEKSFLRSVPAGVNPALGSDVAPTDAAYLANDNVFRCPQYGPDAKPINAVALAYDAPVSLLGQAPDLTFNLYLWDEFTEEWYEFGTVDIGPGQIKFIALPNLVDRKDSRQVSRIAVAFVCDPPVDPLAGDYEFSSSAVTGVSSLDPSAFAGIVAELTLIKGDTGAILADTAAIAGGVASIDAKLINPLPVIGSETDDTPAGSEVLQTGATFVADIYAAPVSTDGHIAKLLADVYRQLRVRTAGYDETGDGVRALVANSLAEPLPDEFSATSQPSGTVASYYLDMTDYEYFSVQWASKVGTDVKTLKFYVTNQDDGTAAASCSYTDVTQQWFGAASFTDVGYFEKDTPVTCKYVKVEVTVAAGVSADNGWVMYSRKRRQ